MEKLQCPEGMSQSQWEKEFLNPIVYQELKRRRLTDKQIVLYYDIRDWVLYEFKKKHGFRNYRKYIKTG